MRIAAGFRAEYQGGIGQFDNRVQFAFREPGGHRLRRRPELERGDCRFDDRHNSSASAMVTKLPSANATRREFTR